MTNLAEASWPTIRCWSRLPWMYSVGGILIILVQMQLSSAALRENEPCMLNASTPGTCRPYATCRGELTNNNIKLCGHNSKGAIVCCPNRRTTSRSGRLFWEEPSQSFPISTSENDPCTLDGTPGTCRPYATCREEIGNNIQICAHTANGAVVCCPNSESHRSAFSEPTRRKSSQKCSKYRELVNHNVAAMGLSLGSIVSISKVPTCDSITESLIVGGKIAKPKEFPHMAALGWRNASDNTKYFKCGGSLISERYILTAAHCLVSTERTFPSFVRLGDTYLLRDDDGSHPQDYEIEKYIVHPKFKRKNGTYNDIALLKLSEDVSFNDYIRPACLYGEETAPEEAIATGYGSQEHAKAFSNELMKVSLKIYDNERCNRSYAGTKYLREGMKKDQLCAGDIRGGFDTCQGDSGGPLQITEQGNHCSFIVFGITSQGQYCGGISPGIYTRVAAYLDWIEANVWP